MSLRFTAALLFLTACDGGPNDTDTGDAGPALRVFGDFVNTTTAYVGDSTCIGTDLGTVDPAKQVTATLNGLVIDFQSDDEVPDADVRMWLGDDISGDPDLELASDASGAARARRRGRRRGLRSRDAAKVLARHVAQLAAGKQALRRAVLA